jgi:hypothetical protein
MEHNNKLSRRHFVKTVVGTVAVAGIAGKLPHMLAAHQTSAGMPVRDLGKTGHKVRIFSLGGQATLETAGKTDESLAIINRALDLGVNYIDTAAWYGNGISEQYIGQVMKTRRKEVFLATKTHDRSYDGSMRYLERSLKNLQTGTLDLWQLHNVRTQDDLDRMSVEAMLPSPTAPSPKQRRHWVGSFSSTPGI